MKKIIILALLCLPLLAQKTVTTESGAPPEKAWVSRFFYDGDGNTQYVCTSPQRATTYSWAIGGTLTSVAVSSNVGTVTTTVDHGLYVGAWVTIAASGNTPLNGSYRVVTVPTARTFTIATVGVADATVNAAGMTVSTRNPRENDAQWAVQVFSYASSVLVSQYWAYPNVQLDGVLSVNARCSDRASY